MREIFEDLLAMPEIRAVLFFSPAGKLVFAEPDRPGGDPVNAGGWAEFLGPLAAAREADLIFEGARVVVRRVAAGQLVILLEAAAPSAMTRLHCDIALAKLAAVKPARGIRRFFKS